MYAMARSAICCGQFSAFESQTVIAAGIRWQAIRWQIIAQGQPGIAMATPAGFRGNIGGI